MKPFGYFEISCLLFLTISLTTNYVCGNEASEEKMSRIDVFHNIADTPGVGNETATLSVAGLQRFVDKLVNHLSCEEHTGHENDEDHDDDHGEHQEHGEEEEHHDDEHDDHDHDHHHDEDEHEHVEECHKFMCINATDLASAILKTDNPASVNEEDFEQLSVVLLHLITAEDGHDSCHKVVNFTSISEEHAREHLLNRTLGVGVDATEISSSAVVSLLNKLKEHIVHDNHDHGHDDEHGDDHSEHDHEGHEEDHDGHDHGDEEDGHEDHTGHDHESQDDHEHTEGGHDAEDHADDHHDHEGHDHDGHEGHDHDDHEGEGHDDHEGHDHDDDDHDEDAEHLAQEAAALIVGKKCLSEDSLKYYMKVDITSPISVTRLEELATLVTYMVYDGSDVKDKCRDVAYKEEFIESIFSQFVSQGSTMDRAALQSLMTQLGASRNSGTSTTQDDHSDHDDHAGHDHKRRRRSVVDTNDDHLEHSDLLVHRQKRQATVSENVKTCYSADQLMAIYDSYTGLDQQSFQELCPSLVSQALFADCTGPVVTPAGSSKDEVSDKEKYGYGTLSIAIICACAVFGIVVFPCASRSAYGSLMSLFLGLAVGTLFADAILHLIPSAMGVHNHGDHDGHDHGSGDYKVEEFVRFGLAIMGGLYLFYLLEIAMSRLGGHSHDLGAGTQSSEMDVFNSGFNSLAEVENGKKNMPGNGTTKQGNGQGMYNGAELNKAGSAYLATSSTQNILTDGDQKQSSGLSPIAMMILLGDAVHNFADGLAVGAAFSSSVSTGIATSIAVFCHELPHELGDFAVLLQSGCSLKKAVMLNLISALTAFAGLYVGIAISTTDTTQKWIFAIAAGMFIYIALTDLLPQLIRTKAGFHVFLNNVGILLGFGVMLIIAVFEEHIEV